jgi:hypothetical protein
VLSRIFGPKRNEVEGVWRRLHDEELHTLYASLNIIGVIKENEMGGMCSTYGRDEKCIQYSGWKNLKGKDCLEDLGIDGKVILEWIIGK